MKSDPDTPTFFSPRRLRALVWKEWLQIVRDPSSILIAFVLPVALLFIFGYGVSLDAKSLPVGIVIEEPNPVSLAFASSFEGSHYFRVRRGTDLRELQDDLMREKLRGIIVIPSDFEKRLHRPGAVGEEAPILVITDGSQPSLATFVENYAAGALASFKRFGSIEKGFTPRDLIGIEARFWFNPSTNSRDFLIPGSLAIIMTVIGALLTSLVIAREWERGTMEALLASPVTRLELLLGKVVPYFILGLVSFFLSVGVAVWLFHVPLRGSLFALFLVASTFLLGALGLGLFISAATKNQFQASLAAINAAFLPALLLSGFIFEIRSMPVMLQWLTTILPARYFVGALQTLFQAGDIWAVLWPKILMLTVMGALLLTLTAKKNVRTLD